MRIKRGTLICAMAAVFASCHNPVFDYEGDCEVTYGLRFVYNMNLEWADAFSTLVNRVELYAFDNNGVLVNKYSLTEAETMVPGYTMMLDLEPGEYTLVAWGALETGINLENAFSIPELTPGVSTIDDLSCSLKTKNIDTIGPYSDSRLPFLYHGDLNINLPDPQDGSYHEYTIYLTKDTNHVRAMVQKVGNDLTTDDVEIWMTAADGEMAWNNSLIGNQTVTYFPWDIQQDVVITDTKAEDDDNTFHGLVADLTACRFTTTMQEGVILTLYNTEEEDTIFSVPVIQYALTAKNYYEQNYGKQMTDQEFLDRQSEYFMTFFIDENMNLLYTIVEILEWRVVIRNYGVRNAEY